MSCSVSNLRVDDVGTEITFQVLDSITGLPVDLTGATLVMHLIDPDGTSTAKTPLPGSVVDITLTAANGWCHYVTIAGDIHMRGIWYIEVVVSVGSKVLTSVPASFFVEDVLHG